MLVAAMPGNSEHSTESSSKLRDHMTAGKYRNATNNLLILLNLLKSVSS